MSNILIAKATAALQESVHSIINCDDDAETKRSALTETFSQFETYLMERNGGTDIAKADRSGPHSLAASLLNHLHDALDRKRQRHGFEKTATKESTPMNDSIEKIAADSGPYGLAKILIDDGHPHQIDEHRWVRLVTDFGKRKHPELSEARAFQKVFLDDGEASRLLRKAHSICKAATANFDVMIADVVPQVVGAADAQDVNDPSAALAALHRIGQERWPEASEAIRFTRAFESNPDLARQAHRTPVGGSTHYPMPNFDLLGSRR
jgi:hypothetical protein